MSGVQALPFSTYQNKLSSGSGSLNLVYSEIPRTGLNEPSCCTLNFNSMDNKTELVFAMNCCIPGVIFFTVGAIRINGHGCRRRILCNAWP